MGPLFGFVCVLVCVLLCLCVCLFVGLFVCWFVCWCVGSFVCLFVRLFVRLFVCLFVCFFVSLVGCLYAKRLPKTHIVGKTSRDFDVAKGAEKEDKSHSPLVFEFLRFRLQSRPLQSRLRKKQPSEESQRMNRRS